MDEVCITMYRFAKKLKNKVLNLLKPVSFIKHLYKKKKKNYI